MTTLRSLALAACAILCGCLDPAATPVVTPVPVDNEVPALVQPDPEAVRAISYEELDLPMEKDTLFQDWMLTQHVRDLDGKRVRITGFMMPGFDSQKIKNFMMLREKECPYGPGGQAHHAIAVTLKAGTARFTTSAVTLEGVLSVEPFTGYNDKTWSVYALTDAELK